MAGHLQAKQDHPVTFLRVVLFLYLHGRRESMTQKEFYQSRQWKRARRAYISKRLAVDGGMCEVCQAVPGKIVHHKIWLDDDNCNDPTIALNENNFCYECQTCHNQETDPRKTRPGRVRYGPNGEIIRATDY
jgi:hypothetical protein